MSAPSSSRWSAFSVRPPSAMPELRVGHGVEPERVGRARSAARPAAARSSPRSVVPPRGPDRVGDLLAPGTPAGPARRPRPRARRGHARQAGAFVVGHGVDASAARSATGHRRCRRSSGRPRRNADPRHRLAAGRLDLVERERPRPLVREPVGGRAVPGGRVRRAGPARRGGQDARARPASVSTNVPGPRLVRADLALQLDGRPRRVEAAVLAPERPRQRRRGARPAATARRSRRRSHGPSGRAPAARRRAGRRVASSIRGASRSPSSGHALRRDDRPVSRPVVHPDERDARPRRRRRGSSPGSASRRGGAAAATDAGSGCRAAAGRGVRRGTIWP